MTLTIDEEFKSLIPPLNDLERLQLEENLEKDGCKDPLITWKGILIDGHNRHEICERLGLEYSTREIILADRDSVKQWMYRNQLGRRNLSPADASELRGRMYNARKKTQGGDRKSKDQNDPLIESTAEVVAKETGVSAATIKRDGEYAEAVDEVAKTDPAIRSKVRKGVVKKKDVIAAAKGAAAVATVKAKKKKSAPEPVSISEAFAGLSPQRKMAELRKLSGDPDVMRIRGEKQTQTMRKGDKATALEAASSYIEQAGHELHKYQTNFGAHFGWLSHAMKTEQGTKEVISMIGRLDRIASDAAAYSKALNEKTRATSGN